MINENQCLICYENFNPNTKTPKKTNCCKNIICLQCLNEIYLKRKLSICPICRCNQKINPNQLETINLKSNQYQVCINCHKKTKKEALYYSFTNSTLTCSNCKTVNDINLAEYLNMVLDDIASINKNYSNNLNINQSHIDKLLSDLKTKLNSMFAFIVQGVLDKIKEKIIKDINSIYSLHLYKNISPINNDLNELQNCIANIKTFVNNSNDFNYIPCSSVLCDINNLLTHKDNVKAYNTKLKLINSRLNNNTMICVENNLKEKEILRDFDNLINVEVLTYDEEDDIKFYKEELANNYRLAFEEMLDYQYKRKDKEKKEERQIIAGIGIKKNKTKDVFDSQPPKLELID